MEDLLTQVKKDTRGVLLSKIGGVPLEGFNRDYRELLGSRFPYRDLGFTDLRSCLESMDDTIRFEFLNDKWMLFGVADEHSFMSSPAIKAQFTPDKPINQRNRKRRNGKKKASDSDDSTGQRRSKKPTSAVKKSTPHPRVNGEASEINELVPNMKGLYSVCLQNLPPEKTQEVIQLFSEVASQEEESRSNTYLFIRYKSYEEASEVISRFHGYQLGDMQLSVIPAREKKIRGRTDKKSQPSVPKEDKKNTLSSFSREKHGKSPKEEAASPGNAASVNTPCKASSGTARQNGRRHREKKAMINRTETNTSSGRGSSRQEDVRVQLPWNKPQTVNGDVLGADNDTSIMRNKAGTDSKSLMKEPVESSAPVNAFSNIIISKPSLPSILDIADRLNSTKI